MKKLFACWDCFHFVEKFTRFHCSAAESVKFIEQSFKLIPILFIENADFLVLIFNLIIVSRLRIYEKKLEKLILCQPIRILMSRTSNNIFQLQRTNPINSEEELTSVKKVIDFFKSDSILIILLKLIKDPFKHEFFLFSIRVNSFLLSLSDSSSFIENLIELLNHICWVFEQFLLITTFPLCEVWLHMDLVLLLVLAVVLELKLLLFVICNIFLT